MPSSQTRPLQELWGEAARQYSLRLCAVLKVTHSADGFGLLAGITVAFVEHLGVTFLSAPVLGVLKAYNEANWEGNTDYFPACN